MSEAEIRQRATIEQRRRERQPTAVRLGHIPLWFTRKLWALRRQLGIVGRDYAPWQMIRDLPPEFSAGSFHHGWLDHWGSGLYLGQPAFISEPYLSPGMQVDAQLFADAIGLRLMVDDNSWWYPGRTTRLAFVQ